MRRQLEIEELRSELARSREVLIYLEGLANVGRRHRILLDDQQCPGLP